MQDRWITDWQPSERWPHYTRANAGEVLPDPASPLGWTYAWERGICQGWRDGYVRLGSFTEDEFDGERPEVVGSFGGYMYINLSNVRMQAVRNPALTVEQLDMAFFGDHPDVPPYVAHPADDRPELAEGIGAHAGWVMGATEWPELLDDRANVNRLQAERPDLTTASKEQLLARAREIQPLLRHLFDAHTISSSSSGIAPGLLAAIGQAVGDSSIPMRVLAGMGEVDSAEPSYALWELSRTVRATPALTAAFDAGTDGLAERLAGGGAPEVESFLGDWEAFLGRFGSRGPNEWELAADTWETDPAIALAALDRIRLQDDGESPRSRNAARAADREAVTGDVRSKLAELPEVAPLFEAALNAARMMGWRERTKTNIIKALHEARVVYRELGRRAVADGHLADQVEVFMLLDDEVDGFVADPAGFGSTLAERHGRWRELFDLQPPFIIADGDVKPLGQWARKGEGTAAAAKAATGDVLSGVAGCPGQATGRARIVLDPSDPGLLEPGDVLIAPLTDPGWTPLFMAASAVVVDVGGQISHAVIVSRELGLPCVVSVEGASRRIPDGAMVAVDGDAGTVTLVG